MKKIAVTGLIGSGKSSVCQILKELGAVTVDSDKIAHQLLDPKTSIGKKIIDLLGEEVVVDGTLSRKEIAKRVFNHPKKLRALEETLHPEVLTRIKEIYEENQGKSSLFVVEIPLLYEIHADKYFDAVILVTSNKPHRISDDYQLRKKRLLPLGEKKKRADFIIENNGTLAQLKQQVSTLRRLLIHEPRRN